jgi:hypothetical protein
LPFLLLLPSLSLTRVCLYSALKAPIGVSCWFDSINWRGVVSLHTKYWDVNFHEKVSLMALWHNGLEIPSA